MPMYQIPLKEQLDQCWSAWLGGLTVTTEANGETLLTGEVETRRHYMVYSVKYATSN